MCYFRKTLYVPIDGVITGGTEQSKRIEDLHHILSEWGGMTCLRL
jgi:hypothetical protein